MITISMFVQELKLWFPSVKFFNGSIDRKNKQCVGVYAKGGASPIKAIGGAENTSYAVLPVRMLIHWTEDANQCEIMANTLYEKLFEVEGLTIGASRVISLQLLDPCPVDISRDETNVAEMVIRLNIFYER